MAQSQVIDWQLANIAERKILYQHARDLKRTLNMSWSKLFEEALTTAVGAEYENNFRKGKISGERAAEIFQWIAGQKPIVADRIEDQILCVREKHDRTAPDLPVSWSAVLQKYGCFENIEVYRHLPKLGIVRFSNPEPINDLRLRLAEEFYFKATFDVPGKIGVLQGYRSDWFLLPIMRKDRVLTINSSGIITLPEFDENGNFDPLCEEEDIGKHRFAFIWSQNNDVFSLWRNWPFDRPITQTQLDLFAETLVNTPNANWLIYRCNLMISGSRS